MDELDAFERLAEMARAEQPPVGGLADRVMVRIAASRRARLRALSFFAAGAAAAAAVMLIAALALANGGDPMAELWVPLEVVSLW